MLRPLIRSTWIVDGGRDLERDAAELAVALDRVAVAEIEQRALGVGPAGR